MKRLIAAFLIFASTNMALAKEACLDIQGMTCPTCSLTVKTAIRKLKGIGKIDVFVERNNAVVEFDPNETSQDAIVNAVNDVGYKASKQTCKKN